jgi:hypothetical protein
VGFGYLLERHLKWEQVERTTHKKQNTLKEKNLS